MHGQPEQGQRPDLPALAAVLATADAERLYPGLSLLVSTAVEGARCSALATFATLRLMLAADVRERALASLARELPGRERLASSLVELLATARELPSLRVYACSASAEVLGLGPREIDGRLDGILSTPRFLREAGAAPLIFV